MNKIDKNTKNRHHLQLLIDYLKIKSKTFASEIGYERADRIYNILKLRNDLTPEVAKDIISKYHNVDYNWLLTGEGEMLKTDSEIIVYNNRYFPFINAAAGLNFLTENNDGNSIPINIPNIIADGFINVFGDSMYPKYSSGEIIGLKRIDKEMVFFGHAYAVQMADGEIYLKYIQPGNDLEHWSLESENSHYKPREFHLKLIDKVFMIKAVISKTSIT